MADYEHTAHLETDPETAFAYLADVTHLPEYFSGLESARATEGDSVHVVAVVEGERYEGEAWMHSDPGSRALRWGADRPSGYHGELFVRSVGDTASSVTVTLHTEKADGPGIDAGLADTLAQLKKNLDGRTTDPVA
ncbi:SRPBCC family protein [Actinomycetospora chiangmaiensis]|uniref:SRPBCC family protein n=1 Tax=Actinomycetospora chiangmaiensis TaxID=402650 RepID=UPI000360B9B0|nr:SRPBCC family protein [Actinomycetospora chiangmaiensis]